jgi:hypothetical protein
LEGNSCMTRRAGDPSAATTGAQPSLSTLPTVRALP